MAKKFRTVIILSISLLLILPFYAEETVHILEKGETLYSLSRKYHIPLSVLLERNNIWDASKLTAGQKIYIPEIKEPEVYTVQKGDTLYSIARAFSVTVAQLKQINNLSDGYVLRIGKKLIIPGKSKQEEKKPSADTEKIAKETPNVLLPANEDAKPADPRAYSKKRVDASLVWPVPVTAIAYLSGKLYGVAIDSKKDAPVTAIHTGKVLSKGPHRGYGQVVFIQSEEKYVYVYGGLADIIPEAGDLIKAGQRIGTLAADPLSGMHRLYFIVYQNNKPIDPAKAPRSS